MSNSQMLCRILAPALCAGVMLLGLCFAAAFVLWSDAAGTNALDQVGPATVWVVVAAGSVTALAAVLLAWRTGAVIQCSFDEVGRQVHEAADRLGRDLPARLPTPDGLIAQVHGLVDGIDRILEDRQQREREVMRADQLAMVGQIAAGVAHELRNPLTSVKMLIQTNIREADARNLPTDDLEIIEQEIRRMEKCLQRFLDFARPPRPERRPISLVLLAERTLALVEGRARKQNVMLSFSPPPAPVVVEADEDQIQQLLVNLVLNALDAMPDGGGLEVRLSLEAGDHIGLHVLDRGPGIAEELFPRLFDPFVSTKETGIGLGLAVSHRIAARHGGSLSAVNRPDSGACFTLRLPVSSRRSVSGLTASRN